MPCIKIIEKTYKVNIKLYIQCLARNEWPLKNSVDCTLKVSKYKPNFFTHITRFLH